MGSNSGEFGGERGENGAHLVEFGMLGAVLAQILSKIRVGPGDLRAHVLVMRVLDVADQGGQLSRAFACVARGSFCPNRIRFLRPDPLYFTRFSNTSFATCSAENAFGQPA